MVNLLPLAHSLSRCQVIRRGGLLRLGSSHAPAHQRGNCRDRQILVWRLPPPGQIQAGAAEISRRNDRCPGSASIEIGAARPAQRRSSMISAARASIDRVHPATSRRQPWLDAARGPLDLIEDGFTLPERQSQPTRGVGGAFESLQLRRSDRRRLTGTARCALCRRSCSRRLLPRLISSEKRLLASATLTVSESVTSFKLVIMTNLDYYTRGVMHLKKIRKMGCSHFSVIPL